MGGSRSAALALALVLMPLIDGFAPPQRLRSTSTHAHRPWARPPPPFTALKSRPRREPCVAMAVVPMGGVSPQIFGAAIGAVTQLVVTTLVGASTVASGLITKQQVSALSGESIRPWSNSCTPTPVTPTSIANATSRSGVVYNVFLPCFLFTSVIKTVTVYGVSPSLLAMPLAAFIQIGLGMLLATKVVLPLTRLDKQSENGRELNLCTTFGNPAVLPLLFFDALFRAPYVAPRPREQRLQRLAPARTLKPFRPHNPNGQVRGRERTAQAGGVQQLLHDGVQPTLLGHRQGHYDFRRYPQRGAWPALWQHSRRVRGLFKTRESRKGACVTNYTNDGHATL